MRPGAAVRSVVALAVIAGPLSGCQSMLFRNDHRIDIVSPANLSTVAQPVTLQWSAHDFSPPDGGKFAVFVDRDPMPPGESMSYFAPNARNNHVYVVTTTTLTLAQLQPGSGASDYERNHHDVTVVLLDPSGDRIGESAGFVEFQTTS